MTNTSKLDRVSGRNILVLWLKVVAEDAIDDDDDDDYKTFLGWYGDRSHKDLWQPMWVERSREMAQMVVGDDNK